MDVTKECKVQIFEEYLNAKIFEKRVVKKCFEK